MPIYKQTTEITNIDDLLSSVERDIEEVYFGDKQVFTVWGEYDGTLPATYSANGSTLADYRIYGSAGGVGDYVASEYKQVHTDTVTIDGIVWDILGYDHDTVYKSDNTLAQHSVTIQAHDVLLDMQFDAKEALFAFDNGFAAGTYHFTVGAQPWYAGDVGKTIQFTLAQALPAGGQLVINNAYNATMVGATISAFASGTATTATETVTMSEGSDGTDLGIVSNELSQDGVINSIQRALRGSNRWSTSDIRQYLNSDAAAGEAWTPQTPFDRPPSWAASTAGFLNELDPAFVAVLGSVKKVTALSTVSDGGGEEITTEKLFLLSQSEVFGGDIVTGGEGVPYSYYKNYSDLNAPGTGADKNRIKYRNGAAKYWWLRSPYVGTANIVRYISPTGTLYLDYATYSYGVAPACVIVLDDMETNDWLREKFLKNPRTAYGYEVPMSARSANLFDPSDTVPYYRYDDNGNWVQDNGVLSSGYMKITAGTTYEYNFKTVAGKNNGICRVNFLNASGQWLSVNKVSFNVAVGDIVNITGNAPTGTAFIRTSQFNGEQNISMTVVADTTPIYISDTPLGEDEYVSFKEQKVYRRTKQLFNAETAVYKNGYYKNDYGDESTYPGAGCYTTYIPIAPGETIYVTNVSGSNDLTTRLYFYDAQKQWILRTDGYTNDFSVVTPSNAAYAQLQISKVFIPSPNTITITQGSTAPSTYIPYYDQQDPPVPLPQLPTVDGTNIVDYAGQSAAPLRFYAKYRKEHT